eukprot:352821-Chlamydomonas_euryale.AAC.13
MGSDVRRPPAQPPLTDGRRVTHATQARSPRAAQAARQFNASLQSMMCDSRGRTHPGRWQALAACRTCF